MGYIVLTLYARSRNMFNGNALRLFSFDKIQEVFPKVLYDTVNLLCFPTRTVTLNSFSEGLVLTEAALRIGAYTLFAIVFIYVLSKKLNSEEISLTRYLLMFFAVSVSTTFLLIIASFARGHSPRHQFFTWYLLAVLAAIIIDKGIVRTKLYRIVGFSVICLLCAVSFYNHTHTAMQSYKTTDPPGAAIMAQYILDNGYDAVLARSFWNANVMGGYSDLQLKTATFRDDFSPYYWLVDTRIFDSEDGKYAIIFSDAELADFQSKASDLNRFILQQMVFDKKFDDLNIYSLDFNPMRQENIKDSGVGVKPNLPSTDAEIVV
jgi:hypothetical protein